MQVTGNNPIIKKRLSIRVSTDGFSFLSPKGRNDFAAEGSMSLAEQMDNAIRRHRLQEDVFTEVQLLVDLPSTRIPLDEFRSEEALSLYRVVHGDEAAQGMSIRYEVLPHLDVVEVFPVYPEWEEVVHRYFPEATVHGYFGQALLQALTVEKRLHGDEKRLHVFTETSSLFLCCFDDGKLSFANTYYCNTLMDQRYFVLRLWTLLNRDQEKDRCLIYGDGAAMKESLKKFIRKIECV